MEPMSTMTATQIADIIRTCIGSENVIVNKEFASVLNGQSDPIVWVEPVEESQVVALLQLAYQHGWKVAPIGGATQLGCGNLLQPVTMALSLKKLNRIVDYSPADLVVTVQPGVRLMELQELLARHGQMLPIDPTCSDEATVGGLVSTMASGPRRVLYGTLRDMTIGLRTVYPNGDLVKTGGKVVKNVAGYDMTKLFVGSFGTLAVLTEITFKLRPAPLHRETCLLHGTSEQVHALRSLVMNSHLIPSRLEAYVGYHAAGRTPNVWTVGVDCDENESAAVGQSEQLRQWANELGMSHQVRRGDEADRFWQSYQLHQQDCLTTIRFSTPPTELVNAAQRLLQYLEDNHQNGQLSLSLAVGIGRLTLASGSDEFAAEVVKVVRHTADLYGGTAVIEAGTLALHRLIDAFGPPPSYMSLLSAMKRSIDPTGVLNPGRFVGGM